MSFAKEAGMETWGFSVEKLFMDILLEMKLSSQFWLKGFVLNPLIPQAVLLVLGFPGLETLANQSGPDSHWAGALSVSETRPSVCSLRFGSLGTGSGLEPWSRGLGTS
ncbi:hypothetical protein KIL84_008122 [Mauremys mutica]|uniref:Uncharacterized protein n=1 Tax=Mauremys mutica TaxID=74926 RepID=A0A9D3WNB3_9SAUR|nr:hypothetical protein KIL84_008122 [Mauremys mutica]